MLVYLSKKIAIPNDTLLTTLSWHKTEGFIACGGADGMLKVLKLEVTPCKDSAMKGLAAPSNLAMNQGLTGHTGSIQVVAWNEKHNKLASSDQNGLIIVWILYKGMWREEMINNRNKSVVRHMKWNRDGSKICIVYEDGAVIVGAVDGNRLWGKELKGLVLTHVQWSPDSKIILFGNAKGEVQIYNSHGTFNSKLVVQCLSEVTDVVNLVAVEWYDGKNGYIKPNCPCLAVAFENGRIQLMCHELDDDPILLVSVMMVKCAQWNHDGSLLALGGSQKFQDGKEFCSIQFYSTFGHIQHTMHVPGRQLCSVTWEGTGLRLALAVGPYIYFANVRHNYKWGFFSDTIVYAFKKVDKVEDCVVFWNSTTGEKQPKTVNNLLAIASCTDFCVLVARLEEDPSKCTLQLCDALGTQLDTRLLELDPMFVCMSQTHVVACSLTGIFVWHYRTTSHLATELTHVSTKKGREGQDRLIHVDLMDRDRSDTVDFSKVAKPTSNRINSVCCSDMFLVVSRQSGEMKVYVLPGLSLLSVQNINCVAQTLALNSNSTKLSVIDASGDLGLYDVSSWLSGTRNVSANRLPMERKEVWDLCWSADMPDLLAIMEKTRMYILRGIEPEEPVISSGQICQFGDLRVKSVLLDEILMDPEHPKDNLVFELEIKALRDTRDLLETVGLIDTQQFIQDNPHPRLWQLLAEAALEQLELDVAEKAFVKSKDYPGLQLVKRLKKLESEPKQQAEVQAYYMRFDEAEKSYLKMDRRDLALDLRLKFGDWFRVMQIIKSGGAGNDVLLAEAWNALGDYYADRCKWQQAVTYYNHARNYDRLAECFYRLEDYTSLEGLAAIIPDKDPLLEGLAEKFILVGMCDQAIEAYVKLGKVTEAIDCCVELNQWDLAMDLARKHHIKDVDVLLVKYASRLLDEDKILSAIELYRKANQHLEAAKLIEKVAKEASKLSLSPSIIKKMYVLSALEVEKHISLSHQYMGYGGSRKVVSTLKSILTEDSNHSLSETEMLNQPWRRAEAYHFYILTQSLFYAGKLKESLHTAIYLCEFEDVLPSLDFYSLLALTSSASKAFGICSKAFIKLESMDEELVSEEQRKVFENLALEIFTRHAPKDTEAYCMECPTCSTVYKELVSRCWSCDVPFALCLSTGLPVLEYQAWYCPTCKRPTNQAAIAANNVQNCPLCHTPIN